MMWTYWSPRLSPGLLLLKKDNRKPALYPRPLTLGLRRWSLGEEGEQNQKLAASLAHSLKQNPVSKQTKKKKERFTVQRVQTRNAILLAWNFPGLRGD